MIDTSDGARLCAEGFGDPDDPDVLLIMGMSASMVWWDEDLCRALARGGRHVIRYDHRDTGRSTGAEPGRPDYHGGDLVDDAAAVLDGYGLASAHVVGQSMGGALAQQLTLERPERVRTLTLISTSPIVPAGRELPGMADAYREFLAGAEPVDHSDHAAAAERLVAEWRVLSGTERPFDAERVRALASADLRRARDPAAAANHALIDPRPLSAPALSAIVAPTLVVHGSADPLFALAHGEALADAIPDARLLTLPGAGHGPAPPDWDALVTALLAHTARA